MKLSTIITILATASTTLAGCTVDICAKGGGCTTAVYNETEHRDLPGGNPPYRDNLSLIRVTSGAGLTFKGWEPAKYFRAGDESTDPAELLNVTEFWCKNAD